MTVSDRTHKALLEYNKTKDTNAFMFLDSHSKCSIWFKDFYLVETISIPLKTTLSCKTCGASDVIAILSIGLPIT